MNDLLRNMNEVVSLLDNDALTQHMNEVVSLLENHSKESAVQQVIRESRTATVLSRARHILDNKIVLQSAMQDPTRILTIGIVLGRLLERRLKNHDQK